MNSIDNKLNRYFHSLPFSFSTVVNEIDIHEQHGGELMNYVNYLLDDSSIPDTVREVFKPEETIVNIGWDHIVTHYKLIFFKKGVSDHSLSARTLNSYHERDFDRISELNEETGLALRLQLKDEIIKELVRAYVEGVAAADETSARPGLSLKDTTLNQLVDEYRKNSCLNARIKKKQFPPVEGEPYVTFFMLVTDRDILIADYCVKSFSLLSNLDFKLVVFCNWVTSENRKLYFEKWRKNYPFVDILEPEWMTDNNRPGGISHYGYGVEGPYERCEVPWDRELPKFKSEYYATIDADFELLNPGLLHMLIEELESSASVGYAGTDMINDLFFTDDDHPGKNILRHRFSTWCCIYKRGTLSCKVSHLYYDEKSPREDVVCNVWDSSGLRQLALRNIHGYREPTVHAGYQPQFIHYGAFSKNKHLNEKNIETWRQLMILKKVGYENFLEAQEYSENKAGLQQLLRQMGVTPSDAWTVSELATEAYNKMFHHVDSSNPYKNEWGKLQSDESLEQP